MVALQAPRGRGNAFERVSAVGLSVHKHGGGKRLADPEPRPNVPLAFLGTFPQFVFFWFSGKRDEEEEEEDHIL